MANTSFRLIAPYLRWGTNLANAIYFPFPLDNVFSGSEPRAGSEFVQAPSGVEAASRVGTDYVLAGLSRWVPQSDAVFYARATGWDGTLGVRAALEWLQNKQAFSWHPDGRNLLRFGALNGAVALGASNFSSWVASFDAGLTGTSATYDGVENAIKIVATNPTGSTKNAQITQLFPAIAGEQFTVSVDYKVTGLSGGANGIVVLETEDISITPITTYTMLTGLVSTGYARPTAGPTAATLANTAYLAVALRLQLPTTAAGTIWFKNALVRRDSTDPTFIDNPSVDSCYLVEPIQFSPANETDGSRQLVMKIRSASSPFNGY